MFGLKKKAKQAIRNKIIITYLDNYILSHNGTKLDEWGNTWMEKSFNEVLDFYRKNEKSSGFIAKFNMVPARIMYMDLNKEFIFAPYKILFEIYFGKEPTLEEMDALTRDFAIEKTLRNITIE